MANVVKKSLTKEIEELTSFSYGFFDMYYHGGACLCYETSDYLIIVMEESSYSDCGGGIERKSGIQIHNRETKELLGKIWLEPYRDMESSSHDNYSLQIVEVLDVELTSNTFRVSCKGERGNSLLILVERGKES